MLVASLQAKKDQMLHAVQEIRKNRNRTCLGMLWLSAVAISLPQTNIACFAMCSYELSMSLLPIAAMFSAKLPLHWFCLCLPFASATLPALEIDDECQSGECALEAIQLKGEMAEHLDADEGCQDVRSGDCLVDVVWAKNEGIRGHPDWYPGLSPESRLLA